MDLLSLTHTSWLKCPVTIPHTEGFICAIQEQEVELGH